MKSFAIALMIQLLLCGICMAQASEDAIQQFLTDYDEAVALANETDKPIFLYVYHSS